MDLPALHTVRMRALLTALTTEPAPVGRLARLALTDPGRLTEAEVTALGEAMSQRVVRTGTKDAPQV